ncbi:MAG: chemotaxis protein CheC [Chloroflexi bacterium]|nr:chemotaxis protein CheC [Chloroflexota bacterium]
MDARTAQGVISAAVLRQLTPAIEQAAASAAGVLGEMAGRNIATGGVTLRQVALAELPLVAGDPERPVVAVHLGVQGATPGHILLALSERMASGLVDMLLGQPEGTTTDLDELGKSALAEAGNVAGSFFLTALAERARVVLAPTPPLVLYDMCGAILDTLAAELALLACDEAIVIETQFTCDGQVVDAAFFMFPAPALLGAVACQEVGHVRSAGH